MKRCVLWCLPAVCFLLSRCTKDPLNNLSNEESRIYITNHDTSVRFSNYATFAIADSVAYIADNRLQGKQASSLDQQFINAVASSLKQRGFQQVSTDQKPDLGVTVSVIRNTSTQLISYPDYGGYYGDYWDAYSWGYPGYDYYFPSYYGVYQSNETDLAVDVIDLRNAGENNDLKAVWSGLIRGEDIFNPQNVNAQIAALFNQSSYLHH